MEKKAGVKAVKNVAASTATSSVFSKIRKGRRRGASSEGIGWDGVSMMVMPYGTLKDRQSASVLMSKEQQSCFNFGTFKNLFFYPQITQILTDFKFHLR